MRKTKIVLRSLTIGLGVIIIGLGLWHVVGGHQHHKKAANPVIEAEGFGSVDNFSLTNHWGDKFGLKDLKGDYWLANFIFTRCGGPCPIISTKMAGLQKEYKDRGNLKFVSFSVDPEYDTPEILKTYAERYDAIRGRWYFLTGKLKEVYYIIRESFHLAVGEPVPAGNKKEMDVLHSLHFVLVNPMGEIKGYFNSNSPEAMEDLRKQLDTILDNNVS